MNVFCRSQVKEESSMRTFRMELALLFWGIIQLYDCDSSSLFEMSLRVIIKSVITMRLFLLQILLVM